MTSAQTQHCSPLPKAVRPELVEGPFFPLHRADELLGLYAALPGRGVLHGAYGQSSYRIAQHASGTIPGFTADKLPVTLVWSQEFSTRIEALEAERRIKG